MKLFTLSLVLAAFSIQAISALKCMQGIEYGESNANNANANKAPEITECTTTSTIASTGLLFLVKPNTIGFPSGDYKCYHLKYEDKKSGAANIIKGCIYSSLNVCDGKFSADSVSETFCSQCSEDGCNAAGSFGFNLKLLALTLAALIAYFIK